MLCCNGALRNASKQHDADTSTVHRNMLLWLRTLRTWCTTRMYVTCFGREIINEIMVTYCLSFYCDLSATVYPDMQIPCLFMKFSNVHIFFCGMEKK